MATQAQCRRRAGRAAATSRFRAVAIPQGFGRGRALPCGPIAGQTARGSAATALPPEVYLIGCGGDAAVQGQASAQTMGFKAWNLLRMAQLSLPVPAGLRDRNALLRRLPAPAPRTAGPDLWRAGLRALERSTGQVLGDARRPLLLSVRSGAPVSMPGMMETLLNIGLCDATVGGLMRQTGNPRLVWDAYRRLVATYGEVVAGLPASELRRGCQRRSSATAMSANSTSPTFARSPSAFSRSMQRVRGDRFRRIPPSSSAARSRRCLHPGNPPRRASTGA